MSNPDNKPVALSGYRGKPLVVNFWARWCPPCRAEIPELAAFRKHHQGRIEVLGIGIEDDAEAVRDFVKAYEMNYPVFLAREHGLPLMKALGNVQGGLPFTVFINARGEVIGQKLGRVRQKDLDEAAASLLKR
ncbi:MAG: TlpA family protein disulfide reductase [Azonexus sp.]|nr:TlpA family protein disulfide reductase [Azonexus sp.]